MTAILRSSLEWRAVAFLLEFAQPGQTVEFYFDVVNFMPEHIINCTEGRQAEVFNNQILFEMLYCALFQLLAARLGYQESGPVW